MQVVRKTITAFIVGLAVLVALPIYSSAGPLSVGEPWGEFNFDATGFASACISCTPSSAGNSFFLDAPPWTFSGSGFLIVQDAFLIGDQFEVFDFDVSLGTTSPPGSGPGCGDNPVECFSDPDSSRGIFAIDATDHSFTIRVASSPFGGGAAYLCIDSGRGDCGVGPISNREISEPGSILLLTAGLLGVVIWVKRPELCRCLVRIRRKRERR